jgi:hypothetical protein
MENDLKLNNGRRPQKKMEDNLKNKKQKTNQSTKINLIGCDTIVNSPSSYTGCLGYIIGVTNCFL